MNKNIESEQKLEQALHRALRSVPLRTAPASLEARVMNELARRATMPWWQASFTSWPVAARVGFVLTCAALIAATILGGVSAYVGGRPFGEASALVLAWVSPFLTLISSVGGLVAVFFRVIPPMWLYGTLGIGIFLYVTLFGLGAAAYRTLYLQPSLAGNDL
jgi:hypothetical protein